MKETVTYYAIEAVGGLYIRCFFSALWVILGVRLLDKKDFQLRAPVKFKKIFGLSLFLFGVASFIQALFTVRVISQ